MDVRYCGGGGSRADTS
ncbi:hypothetical protein GBAR_LOCUS18841 [Geodia barretti]|uniref:Uncharacterized protein n=1 Tax=Geodia barretti TaxID=519541 RepID=A0AA35X0K9_GEOBA|nr:hypothetical protein GBAR_LOCUS18841 [Geodia barretti]